MKKIILSLLVLLIPTSVQAQPMNPLLYTPCGGYGQPNCAMLQAQYQIDLANWQLRQNSNYYDYGQDYDDEDYDGTDYKPEVYDDGCSGSGDCNVNR